MPNRYSLLAVAALLCAAPLVTACGDATGTEGDAGVQVTGELGEKPEITVPEGDAPEDLVVHDLVVGDGATAESGVTVTTHYVGVAWSDGTQFDASWDRGDPVSFPLDRVISGWSEGIPGMRVGGRRLLVVPPDQAYGDAPPPGIAPGETLVFVVDLVDVAGG